MTQIHPRHKVVAAYCRATALGASHDEAVASVAQALGLAQEAVQAVVEECTA